MQTELESSSEISVKNSRKISENLIFINHAVKTLYLRTDLQVSSNETRQLTFRNVIRGYHVSA